MSNQLVGKEIPVEANSKLDFFRSHGCKAELTYSDNILVNDHYIVAKLKPKWCVKGKNYTWYWYKSLEDLLYNYILEGKKKEYSEQAKFKMLGILVKDSVNFETSTIAHRNGGFSCNSLLELQDYIDHCLESGYYYTVSSTESIKVPEKVYIN